MTTEAWLAKKRQLIESNKKIDGEVKEGKTLGLKRTNTVPKIVGKKSKKVKIHSSADVLKELEKYGSDSEEVNEKDAEMKESHSLDFFLLTTVEVEKKEVDNKQVDSKTEEQKEVNDPRQKSWQEAARGAGVILISDEGHPGLIEE